MPILAFVLCFASGYLLVGLAWRGVKTIPEAVLKLSVSAGFGLGIFSVVFFFVRLVGTSHFVRVDASCLALLLVLYLLRRRLSATVTLSAHKTGDIPTQSWVRSILASAFVIALLAAIYHTVSRVIAYPHGDGWDAFSIWNLHARFLFLGGPHWRDGFNSLIPWSHPDYPLLLPAMIAHFWSYLGHDDPIVPAIIGVVFAFSTLTLLVSSLAQLRGRIAALLGGLALLSTPFFVEQGAAQYADVPLSFFILASFVLLRIGYCRLPNGDHNHAGALALAGLAAGFAAWAKNEGLLFLFALVTGHLLAFTRNQIRDAAVESSKRNWMFPFLTGAAPILIVIAVFKHSVAAPGDLLSSPDVMVHKLLTLSRYGVTVRWFVKDLLRFGDWWIVPGTVAMLVFYLLTRRKQSRTHDPLFWGSVLTLGLTLAGYFAIYLITPRDLYWHLRFSLNRLFLQLWPATVFLFFLFAARQEPTISQNEAILA
jgi:hypothetical protein